MIKSLPALSIAAVFSTLLGCTSLPAAREVAQQACQPSFAEKSLNLVHAQSATIPEAPKVTFNLDGANLEVRFEITMDPSKIYAKEKFGNEEYPYQFDVAEVFLKVSDAPASKMTYHEFEITPLNQSLQIKIDVKGGKKTFSASEEILATTAAQITETGWSAKFSIPLEKFGWKGLSASVTGNAFVIIGKPNLKTYWALELPPQTKPSFHMPEHFVELLPVCADVKDQSN
ncbi:MAG: hypothetical protein H7326_04240 [Bdellovibrionaceae bacterium]|nr:hypothetical protein [Pseudobdellovibrionaceae bacterium]